MKRLLVISALLLAFSCTKAHPQPKSFNESQNSMIIVKYLKAMEAQSTFQALAQAYNQMLTEQLKLAGFPPLCGTGDGDCSNVTVDVQSEKVTVSVIPKPKTPTPPQGMQAQPQSPKK